MFPSHYPDSRHAFVTSMKKRKNKMVSHAISCKKNAPPTVGTPFIAASSEAPSDESVLFLSRLSRWMVAVMLDGRARARPVVPIVGSVVPTSTTGHWFRTSRVVVVPLPYSRSKTFFRFFFLSLPFFLFLLSLSLSTVSFDRKSLILANTNTLFISDKHILSRSLPVFFLSIHAFS